MPFWRPIARGLRNLARPSAADREIRDEVQHYLDEAAAAHRARGLSEDDALRAARLEIGSVASVTEHVRTSGWEAVVGVFFTDVRYAARRLRSEVGFTAVTVATLALGVGATTAIFSAVKPILFEPLPYPGAGRIVMVLENDGRNDSTFALYREFAARSPSLDAVAVFKPWRPTLTSADQPERLEGQRASAAYFRVLGVSPILGRDFTASDDRFRGPNVVMLSDALWRRRFGADPAIVGREVTLDDALYTVVGVMPGGFENVLAPAADLWAPLQYDESLPAQGREWGHHLRTVGRLRPGVTIDAATREINGIGRRVVEQQRPPSYAPSTQFSAAALRDVITRGVKPALLAIVGGVFLVLVIACVNVTNLLLARGVRRRSEFALRAALGAGRGRLVRQLLTESLFIASLGGAAGMAVAMLGVRALMLLSPADLPRAGAIGIDRGVFAFGLAITTLIGLAFGLVPALEAADTNARLAHGSRLTTRHHRARSALVIAEVALALVLLVSSGLLLRSLQHLFAVPAGFDAAGVLTMQVQSGGRAGPARSLARFFDRAADAVRGVPGVTAAAFTSQLPLSGDRDEYGATIEATPSQPAQTRSTFRYGVGPGYLEAMRIPLRRGRLLNERDSAGAPLVALVSESLAQAGFNGEDPIGRRLRIGPAGPYTIVGVVGDVRQMSLALNAAEAVYTPAAQWRFPDRTMSLVVRTRGDAAALAPAVRQAIWSVDKDQPVVRIATLDTIVAASAAQRRFALTLFEAFALAALALAAAGIYGVLSGSVTERAREIGVRTALGASRGQILALVLRQGLTLTGFGVAIGLGGALLASRALAAMLFGISRVDPITYGGVIALLAAVSLASCGLPAWRAVHVDPATTLRAE